MENEKILSNEELLDITAGFAAKSAFKPINVSISKYGVRPPRPVLKYGINPGIKLLYAVSPTIESK